jgi:hypothetical protein
VHYEGLYKHYKTKHPTNETPSRTLTKQKQSLPELPDTTNIQKSTEKIQEDILDTDDEYEIKHNKEVQKWNASMISQDNLLPFVMCFYGTRRSGKTTAILDIVNKNKYMFYKIFVFTTNKENMKPYKRFTTNIHNGFNDPVTEKLIKRIMDFQDETDYEKPVLIILDDIIDSENSQHSSGILEELTANNRHYNINLIVSSQRPTKIGPLIRQNCDYAFLFYTKYEDVKKMYKQFYFDSQYTQEEVEELLTKYTQDHGIILIIPSRQYDYVFHYKADLLKD